jgi:hypothetical protein
LLHFNTLLICPLDHLLVDILHHEKLLLEGGLPEVVLIASGALRAASIAAAATRTTPAVASAVRRATSFHRDCYNK